MTLAQRCLKRCATYEHELAPGDTALHDIHREQQHAVVASPRRRALRLLTHTLGSCAMIHQLSYSQDPP
jgi:hypothetical protein